MKAVLGTEAEESYSRMWKARARIIAAAHAYGRLTQAFEDQQPERAAAMRSDYESIIWDGWAEASEQTDLVREDVEAAVNGAEKIVKPLLTPKSD